VLRNIFGRKREEVAGVWRTHNEEEEMGGAHSMHGRDKKYVFWLENLKGRDHMEDLGTDGRY